MNSSFSLDQFKKKQRFSWFLNKCKYMKLFFVIHCLLSWNSTHFQKATKFFYVRQSEIMKSIWSHLALLHIDADSRKPERQTTRQSAFLLIDSYIQRKNGWKPILQLHPGWKSTSVSRVIFVNWELLMVVKGKGSCQESNDSTHQLSKSCLHV